MAATIDCKNPSLVIVGHWNAAILNEPGWIAKNILEVPEGTQIDLSAVVVGNQVGPNQVSAEKQIWLFETFGLACTGQRLELFSRDIENRQPLYEAVARLTNLLPHTPARAVGTNFDVQVTGDISPITPAFETEEVFDTFGKIMTQDRSDGFEIFNDDLMELNGVGKVPSALNLTRKTDFKTVEMSFNYHLPIAGMESLSTLLGADPIGHWRDHALRVLSDCYGIDAVEYAYF
ncbi:hypothetical protein [uncultured Roseobacter sp.]|uniref:hypothetical protein n=1 Tax=uncultured Roseobacter sp. TaxID=114847 RepID=UPI0026335714|nr:hypothetical protein [uncultured Roseobacter sp.]